MEEITIETEDDLVNVVVTISGERVVFACTGPQHADDLKEALEQCAWFQIETNRST